MNIIECHLCRSIILLEAILSYNNYRLTLARRPKKCYLILSRFHTFEHFVCLYICCFYHYVFDFTFSFQGVFHVSIHLYLDSTTVKGPFKISPFEEPPFTLWIRDVDPQLVHPDSRQKYFYKIHQGSKHPFLISFCLQLLGLINTCTLSFR